MANTTYLVTGASRGIGRALVAHYLSLDHTTVVAAVRNPASADSKSLATLKTGAGSKVVTVALDSSNEEAAAKAVAELQAQGIDTLNVVIANAGISEDFSTIATVPLPVLKKHLEVNAYGPLALFQAVAPLLEKAGPGAKFVGVGSPLGSIGGMEQRPYPMAAYGMSKALLHYLVRKVHLEHKDITAFVVDPGFVQTDMGNTGAKMFGMEQATDTLEDSVGGLIKEIDAATKESTSGHFRIFTGDEFPW